MLERRISTANSTTTPLGLAASYVGTFDAVQHFSSVTVVIHSDVTSITDGVQLIWSNDGISEHKIRYYEHGKPGFPFTPFNTGTAIQSQVEGRYLKVRFLKSGAENQTSFQLQTTFGYAPASIPMRRIKDPLADEDLMVPVVAQIAQIRGEENDNNSTTALLTTDEVFEGTPEDTTGFTQIAISVYADEASATDGLSIEFSTDGVDWDHVETFTIAADTPFSAVFRPKAQWFRVVYTNGSVAQNVFRLQVIYRRTADGSLYALGAPTDAAVDSDTTGTVSGKLRGLVKILANVWSSANGWLRFSLANVENTVSTANSTTALLGSGGVFTGSSFEDTLGYAAVIVAIFADQVSATDGFEVQWSTNGSDVDITEKATILANQGRGLPFSPRARYVRIKYTNGASVQGAFRLQTILRRHAPPSLLRALDQVLTEENFAQLVRAVLAAEKPNGQFTNINATAGGNLKVSVEEFDGGALPVPVEITDGATVASVRDLTNADPLDVALVDADGNQITSFGGGTQYTDEDVDATPTGTLAMWHDAADGDKVRAVSEDKPLPVNVVEGGAGGGADTFQLDGIETLAAHDFFNRRLLEQVLFEIQDLKTRMFAE